MYVSLWNVELRVPPVDLRSYPVAFKVYDMDRDGFISNGELFLVLKMMVGSNLKVRLPPAYEVFLDSR